MSKTFTARTRMGSLRTVVATGVALVSLPLATSLTARKIDRKSVEQDLNATYAGKALDLRRPLTVEKLKFDRRGEPSEFGFPGDSRFFQLIRISDIEVKKDKYIIKGNRVCAWRLGDTLDRIYSVGADEVKIEVQTETDSVGPEDFRERTSALFDVGTLPEWTAGPASGVLKNPDLVDSLTRTGMPPYDPDEYRQSDVTSDMPGGGVTEPKCEHCPKPKFPVGPKEVGLSGVVKLWVGVDENGRPKRIRVENYVGCGVDEAAIDAVRRWRFTPGERNGMTVPVVMRVHISFNTKK